MKVTDQDYAMDGYLQSNLDTANNVIKSDWDMVILVDGEEGGGKSVLAQQCAYYNDPTLCLDRICFTPNEFRKAILSAKKYQAVIYDEAYTGLSARATMSLINRTLISMLAEIRQRNLFVYVVMPTFFDLDKYAAIWRSRALIHVYTAKGFQRGFFTFFNKDRKKDLYIHGKKFYSYGKPPANFHGRFPNHYTVDEKAYREKKRNSLIARENKREQDAVKQEVLKEMFERLAEDEDIPNKKKAKMLGISESYYYILLKRYNEEQEFNI